MKQMEKRVTKLFFREKFCFMFIKAELHCKSTWGGDACEIRDIKQSSWRRAKRTPL